MKSSYKFFLSMMALFILMFLLQMQLPKKFVWNPTFYHADRQPFGCYVFDSIMRQSLPQGYQVTAKTFRQLDEENRNRKIAVVVLDNSLRLKKVDVGHLRKIAQRGGKVMVAYHWGGSDELDSSFHVDMSSGAFIWIISCEGLPTIRMCTIPLPGVAVRWLIPSGNIG